jgi:hypothetical protein
MKTLNKETKIELLSHILDTLNNHEDKFNEQFEDHEELDLSELHFHAFNEDYYIISTYEAKEWIKENYGTFEAIGKIRDYEMENFGELSTDISSPVKVVNMLVYILGEELIYHCLTSTDSVTETITELETRIEDLKQVISTYKYN